MTPNAVHTTSCNIKRGRGSKQMILSEPKLLGYIDNQILLAMVLCFVCTNVMTLLGLVSQF